MFLGVVSHPCNPTYWEAEGGDPHKFKASFICIASCGSVRITQGNSGSKEKKSHPWLHSGFAPSLGYIKPCLKKKKSEIKYEGGNYDGGQAMGCAVAHSLQGSLRQGRLWRAP